MAPSGRGRGWSRAPPMATVAGEQGLSGLRAAGPRPVLFGPAPLGPVLLYRVQDPPREFDLLLAREQRRVADEHIQDEPLVGLGAGFGEGLPVSEVHAHV